MSFALKKLSEHKQEFQTDKMKVPVVLHINDELLPNESTMLQLESVASNPELFHHLAAMADVHSKPGRKNATGTTVVSEKYILPQVNDSDPACGMRIVRTNLTDENTTPEEIDRLFRALVPRVPTKKFIGTFLPFSLVLDIARSGVAPLLKRFNIKTKHELENALGGANFFGDHTPSRRDILHHIPALFIFFAQFRLGILGAAGNHFLDLMKVTGIEDEEAARRLGIKNGQYLFMVHCGSGILGQYSMYMYTAKKREHLSQAIMVELGKLLFFSPLRSVYRRIAHKIKAYGNGSREELFTYEGDAPEGRMYMFARNACSNWAHANRAMITHNVARTVEEVLGRDPGFELLYDMPHILVSQEEHYDKQVWVHRNGTSRAYGPSRMVDHPVFKDTGEPAFIPSSMSTEAYLCVGQDGNTSSFYSCNHGAGKSAKKTESDIPEDTQALRKKLETKGVKLYNGRSSKVIEQDSSHYKRIDTIMEGVKANGIVKPVARMQPVAVIMY